MIRVDKRSEDEFNVTVEGRVTTTHRVQVDPGYAKKLGGEDVDVERLVEASFQFLLEREPNTSILRSFDLSVISRYFPEYERVIGGKL